MILVSGGCTGLIVLSDQELLKNFLDKNGGDIDNGQCDCFQHEEQNNLGPEENIECYLCTF